MTWSRQTPMAVTVLARIPLERAGRWYVRTTHMVETREEPEDYESDRATLTFQVR